MIIILLIRKAMNYRGDMTKKVYKLGDKVCVRVEDADKLLKTVDFVLAD